MPRVRVSGTLDGELADLIWKDGELVEAPAKARARIDSAVVVGLEVGFAGLTYGPATLDAGAELDLVAATLAYGLDVVELVRREPPRPPLPDGAIP